MTKGLALKTSSIIEPISRLECIKPYLLTGGTALSLQLNHRLSEDLDFMKWKTSRNEKMEVDWPTIKNELDTIGQIQHMDILDFDHVEFVVDDVKLSFYASPRTSPVWKPQDYLNNIKLADISAIMIMKLEVMLRRNKFRDFYDIYSILKDTPINIHNAIKEAIKHSNYALKSTNLMRILTNPDRFVVDSNFKLLNPKYDVSSKDIAEFIKIKFNETNKTWLYGQKDRLFIKTIINGEERMGKLLKPADVRDYEIQKIDLEYLRNKYFKDELKNSTDIKQTNGFKR